MDVTHQYFLVCRPILTLHDPELRKPSPCTQICCSRILSAPQSLLHADTDRTFTSVAISPSGDPFSKKLIDGLYGVYRRFQQCFSYSTAASATINAFLEFFYQYSPHYSYQATGCFPKAFVEATGSGERGMILSQ